MKISKVSVLVWTAVAVLFCLNVAVTEYFSPLTHDTSAGEGGENIKVSLTISAAGDCTLGADVSFGYGSSFNGMVEKVDEDYSYFLENVEPIFKNDDLTIVNFEGTLSERGKRQDKLFAFRGDPDYASVLSVAGVEAANLANNHTKDYGPDAVSDTKKALSQKGITTFGHDDISIMNIKGIKVGLIGTNALNTESRKGYPDAFKELKKLNPDLIIANFHWGSERAAIPNYDQIEMAHKAIDNGADLVIGHHPHVIQGIEKYKGKYIVYSLGNFCFGGNSNPSDKDTMIFCQTFEFENGKILEESEFNASVIPCSISSVSSYNNYQPTPLTGNEYKRVKAKIEKRSKGFDGIEDVEFK